MFVPKIQRKFSRNFGSYKQFDGSRASLKQEIPKSKFSLGNAHSQLSRGPWSRAKSKSCVLLPRTLHGGVP